jgi:hypothetical protein
MTEISYETLQEYVQNALKRPSNFGTLSDAMYVTHGLTFSWADRGDDLREESNYHVALKLITESADDDDHVIDAHCRHWGHGSVRELFVQVYESHRTPKCMARNCEESADYLIKGRIRMCSSHTRVGADAKPIKPKFTAAWKEAVALAESLHDNAVLDDSDHSERESERFEGNLADALRNAQSDYWDDTDEQEEAITECAIGSLRDLYGHEPDGGVDWDDVEQIYGEHRDAYFEAKAEEIASELSVLGLLVRDLRPCPGNGQLALDVGYPRITSAGETVWACCLSSIGRTCKHRDQP